MMCPPMPSPDGAALVVEGLTKVFRDKPAVDQLTLQVARGRLLRVPGPERRGQEHDDQDAHGPAAAHLGRGVHRGARPQPGPAGRSSASSASCPRSCPSTSGSPARSTCTSPGACTGSGARRPEGAPTSCWSSFPWSEDRGSLIVDYSQGMRKKLALAAALIHNPRVLFLDEPLNGIDPVSGRVVTDLLRRLAQQGRHAVLHHPRAGRGGAALRRGRDHRPRAHRGPGHARRDPPQREVGHDATPRGRLPEARRRRRVAARTCRGSTDRARRPALAAGAARLLRRPRAAPGPRAASCPCWLLGSAAGRVLRVRGRRHRLAAPTPSGCCPSLSAVATVFGVFWVLSPLLDGRRAQRDARRVAPPALPGARCRCSSCPRSSPTCSADRCWPSCRPLSPSRWRSPAFPFACPWPSLGVRPRVRLHSWPPRWPGSSCTGSPATGDCTTRPLPRPRRWASR